MARYPFEILRVSGVLGALGATFAACTGSTAEPARAPETATSAQDAPAGSAVPTAEQLRVVKAFDGEWVFHTVITPPGAAPTRADLAMSCARTAGGRASVCGFRGEIPAMGYMDASILVGVDRLDNKVHFMAITSDDELHDHVCSWKDEQHLDCEPLRGGLGGQPITEDLSFTFDASGAALRSITRFTDGGELSFVGSGSRLDAPARTATGSSKPAGATGDQRKLIETFLGKWKWDAQIALPNGKQARAAFDLKCQAAAAGKATLCTLVAGDVVGRPFEATLLLGHDPFDKNVHLMMMSSDDEVWHRICTWTADTQLACGKMQTGVMGMPATTELTFNVTGQQGSARWLTELRDGKTCLLTAQMSR